MGLLRYDVVPLSPNSGLIGWVPDHDTLHVLIRDHREAHKVILNVEHRLMLQVCLQWHGLQPHTHVVDFSWNCRLHRNLMVLQMAPDYDNLTLMQKIEVFEDCMVCNSRSSA